MIAHSIAHHSQSEFTMRVHNFSAHGVSKNLATLSGEVVAVSLDSSFAAYPFTPLKGDMERQIRSEVDGTVICKKNESLLPKAMGEAQDFLRHFRRCESRYSFYLFQDKNMILALLCTEIIKQH